MIDKKNTRFDLNRVFFKATLRDYTEQQGPGRDGALSKSTVLMT